MTRLVCLLFVLLILHWIFSWKLAEWKVKKIQQSSEHIEQKIDGIIESYMSDPEAYRRIKAHLKK